MGKAKEALRRQVRQRQDGAVAVKQPPPVAAMSQAASCQRRFRQLVNLGRRNRTAGAAS